jgi:hypothetical protein
MYCSSIKCLGTESLNGIEIGLSMKNVCNNLLKTLLLKRVAFLIPMQRLLPSQINFWFKNLWF